VLFSLCVAYMRACVRVRADRYMREGAFLLATSVLVLIV